jgi:RNA polymerase sigma factor (sigma-70 family)
MGNDRDHESASLWDDFREGDDDAYIRIYEKYANKLYGQGFLYTKNKEIIKDCIQEVFTKIYQYRSGLSATDNVKNYLMASMRNQLLTVLSKEKVYTSVSPYDAPLPGNAVEKHAGEILEAREASAAIGGKVKHLLSLLTDRQREAVYYRYIECLEANEICALMNLNYQSLQNILHRSLKKIRQHLGINQEENSSGKVSMKKRE